jgi:hypothetical protein
MDRFHRRRAYREKPIFQPSPHGFTSLELLAWLDAICALQIFRLEAGKGGGAGLEAPLCAAGALRP